MLYFTGYSRKASNILRDQDKKSKSKNKDMIENLHFTKDLGKKSMEAILKGNLDDYGKIMHEHWMHKIKRSKNMSNKNINDCINLHAKMELLVES